MLQPKPANSEESWPRPRGPGRSSHEDAQIYFARSRMRRLLAVIDKANVSIYPATGITQLQNLRFRLPSDTLSRIRVRSACEFQPNRDHEETGAAQHSGPWQHGAAKGLMWSGFAIISRPKSACLVCRSELQQRKLFLCNNSISFALRQPRENGNCAEIKSRRE